MLRSPTVRVLAAIALTGCLIEPDPPALDPECWSNDLVPIGGAISSPSGENGPWMSADGNELWFASLWSQSDHDVLRSVMQNGAFVTPDDTSFDGANLEDDPFLDGDGTMWFSSDVASPGQRAIYEAHRTGEVSFDPPVSHFELGTSSDSMEPVVAADRLTIYFAPTDNHLSFATRPMAPGSFDPPMELSCPHHVFSPALGNDPEIMYFTDADLVSGRLRIGRSPMIDHSVTTPELVGTFQTDPTADYFDPYVTPDKIVFARKDASGTHLAYVARIACP